jgi:SSS family solute:Na+ symporter
MITLGTVAFSVAAYVLIWNPIYADLQAEIVKTTGAIPDAYLQSQMLVPVVLRHLLPAGLLGIFAIFMIGSSVSTDDSAYHSWGSIFLQDVVMPFRKKPFTTDEHLKYLRWSIVLIGAISFLFSSIWTMKDFINMWFEITGAIYVGGASCAIIGGLYWKRGTTSAAWAGLLSGSAISVGSIIAKQIWPGLTFPGTDTVINGIHMAVFAVFFSYAVYIIVSLTTCKKPFNMNKLLHRGEYAVEEAAKEKAAKAAETANIPKILRMMGITREFTLPDRIIYVTMILWTAGWSLTFIIGTIYNLTLRELSSEEWKFWWALMLGIQGIVSVGSAIWFAIGGAGDTLYLFRKLAHIEVDERDDGTVYQED